MKIIYFKAKLKLPDIYFSHAFLILVNNAYGMQCVCYKIEKLIVYDIHVYRCVTIDSWVKIIKVPLLPPGEGGRQHVDCLVSM